MIAQTMEFSMFREFTFFSCEHHKREISLVLQNLALIVRRVYKGPALLFRSLVNG